MNTMKTQLKIKQGELKVPKFDDAASMESISIIEEDTSNEEKDDDSGIKSIKKEDEKSAATPKLKRLDKRSSTLVNIS